MAPGQELGEGAEGGGEDPLQGAERRRLMGDPRRAVRLAGDEGREDAERHAGRGDAIAPGPDLRVRQALELEPRHEGDDAGAGHQHADAIGATLPAMPAACSEVSSFSTR